MVPDDARAAGEIVRVLAPGGPLVLSAPALDAFAGAHDRAVGGLRRYTARQLENLLENAGLAVRRTTYANFFLAPPIWLLRKVTGFLSRRQTREEVESDFALSPSPFEGIFFFFLSWEARIVRQGRLPFGVSVFALAGKPGQGAGGTSVAGK
jgi:SAM-dependent methyltransferase